MTATDARSQVRDDKTWLALERTRLAHERTLMAWVRTATSLISFGFTIYKFFQYMHQDQSAAASRQLIGPRGYGLIMIGLGVGALILATLEHRTQIRKLQADHSDYGAFPSSPSTVVAMAVGLIGMLMMVLVILHQ